MDYFRSIQIPKNVPESIGITNNMPSRQNQYTNPTFVASSYDLSFPDRSPTHLQNQKQPQIWSTSTTHFPDNSQFNIGFKPKHLNKNKNKQKKATSSNKRCFLVTILSILVALIIVASITLTLVYNYYWKSNSIVLNECANQCQSNTYCVSGSTPNSNSTCLCKPGYSWNIRKNECEQIVCYSGYTPYTYLNGHSSQSPMSYNSQFLKPYCCPNSNYLTSACCGRSTANTSIPVSKRIIGGRRLNEGVFPWVVYVTQVYRSSLNEQFRMIKNCSGTLLSERHVLTAGHCLDINQSLLKTNPQLPTIESIVRVYFGFVDKDQVFRPNKIAAHERRVLKATFHPKYNKLTLKNDLVVLHLDRPVDRDINSDYLCMNSQVQDDTVSKLYTAGWGSTNPNHLSLFYPNRINYVDAVVFPMSFCKYIYPDPMYSFLFNSTTHVCAGYQAAVGMLQYLLNFSYFLFN